MYEGLSLTASKEETRRKFHAAIENGKVSQQDIDEILGAGYETLVLPYIQDADYVVIDHGFNDRLRSLTSLAAMDDEQIDWESRDRTNFIGALNFLIDIIHERNPSAGIILGGYFQNTFDEWGYCGSVVCRMQERIASNLHIPLMRVWENVSFGGEYVPGTSEYLEEFNRKFHTSYENIYPDKEGNVTKLQYYCPDGVHPHSDLSGRSNAILDDVYVRLLREAIYECACRP